MGEQGRQAEFFGEVALGESFVRGLGAHWHEYGGFDGPVRRMEQSRTGTGVRAFGDNFEGDLGQLGACISMIADRTPDGVPLGAAARTRPRHRWPRQSSTSSGSPIDSAT